MKNFMLAMAVLVGVSGVATADSFYERETVRSYKTEADRPVVRAYTYTLPAYQTKTKVKIKSKTKLVKPRRVRALVVPVEVQSLDDCDY